MRRLFCYLCSLILILLLAGCRESGCRLAGNPDQPAAKILFNAPNRLSEWRGIKPGISTLEQAGSKLAAMPDVEQDSILIDHYQYSEGTSHQELEKIYFNFLPGNNARQEMFFQEGILKLISFNAMNLSLEQALNSVGEPEWVLSTNFCNSGWGRPADQIDLLYPSKGIALQLYGAFSEEIKLEDGCHIERVFLFVSADYEDILLSQIESGKYLDLQVRDQRLLELNQRMQTWRGIDPPEHYHSQPCPY